MQVFYHQFLTSAISVLFLASVHAPVRFSATCREEFYMALELVKDLSAKSWVSKRLWRTIGALKEVAPSIGLRQGPDDDPHNTAAITMAGLASGNVSNASPGATYSRASAPVRAPNNARQQSQSSSSSPNNGKRIQNEMSRIFEGYLTVNGFSDPNLNGNPNMTTPGSTGGPPFTPTDTTVFQHFKDMF